MQVVVSALKPNMRELPAKTTLIVFVVLILLALAVLLIAWFLSPPRFNTPAPPLAGLPATTPIPLGMTQDDWLRERLKSQPAPILTNEQNSDLRQRLESQSTPVLTDQQKNDLLQRLEK